MLAFFIDAEKYTTRKPAKTIVPEAAALPGKLAAAIGNKIPPIAANKKPPQPPALQKMMSLHQSSVMETGFNKPPPKAPPKAQINDPKVIMVDTVQEKWYLCILMEHASKGDVL